MSLQSTVISLDNMFENHPAVILLINPADGSIVEANSAAAKFYGWGQAELRRMNIAQINTLPKAEIQAAMERARVQHKEQFRFKHRRADGSIRDVEVFSGPIQHQAQTLLLSIIQDVTEKKELEQHLSMISQAMENSLNAFDIVDANGLFIYVNAAYVKMWGYDSAEEIIGTSPVSHCADPGIPPQIIGELKQTGRCVIEFKAQRKDGSQFDVLMYALLGHDHQGREIYYGTSIDVTERKQTEAALRESLDNMAEAQRITHFGSWEVQLDENLEFLDPQLWSDECYRILGFEPGAVEITKELFYNMVHPDDRDLAFQSLADAIENGGDARYEYRITQLSGDVRHVRDQIRVVVDPDTGRAVKVIGTVTDITEQKLAEQARRESEEKYRLVFENSGDAILLTEIDGTILAANPAACRMFGYTEAEIRRLGRGGLVDTTDPRLPAALEERKRTGIFQGEMNFLHADGHFFPAELTSVIFPSQDGSPKTSIIIRDITARKQAEAALRESEERLRLFIEHAPAALAMFDRDMCYVAVSHRWLTDYGLEGQTVIGRCHYDIFPEIVEGWKAVHRRGLAGEVIRADEDKFVRLGGSVQWLRWEVRPWNTADDHIGGIVIFSEDITTHKQADELLREREASLRQSQRVAHVGHWSWDTVTNRVVWSDEMKRIFGLDPDQFSGDLDQVIMQSIHPEDKGKVIESNKTVLTEQRPAPIEYRVIWPDQTVRTVLAVPGDRVTDEQGNIVKLTGIVQDITERKELEAENERLMTQFHQAQRLDAIGKLAGGIAHDFNNLLVPMIGYAELGMMKLAPDDSLYGNFSRIKGAADRAAGLTRQILAFSRQQVLEMQMIDLNEVITDFQKMFGRLLREDIDLQIHLVPHLPFVKADPGQIEQVLMNLVINARDAMPTGGTLSVETDLAMLDETYTAHHIDTEPGQYVLLAVGDTGHGMDAETRQRIFEPFFTTKERGHGTGLGLATVFGIVKQHRGNIWVYSEPDEGTVFKVYLPVAEETEIASESEPDFFEDQLTGSETVLVVEDDEEVRELVTHTLRTYGYQVLPAATPLEALALAAAHSHPPHLLLTDVVMPEMDGRELYTELVQTFPDLKVLFMSGYTDNVIVHHGRLDPDVAFMAKPFSMQGLLKKVRIALVTA